MMSLSGRLYDPINFIPKNTLLIDYFSQRAPTGHKEVLQLAVEAFKVFGTSAILPQLEKHGEPLFKPMELAFSILNDNQLDAVKLSDMIIERNNLQRQYLDRWMATRTDTAGPMDCIIAPAAVAPAARLGYGETMQYFGFTIFGNLLGMFSLCLPLLLSPCVYAHIAILRRPPLLYVPSNIRRQDHRLEERCELEAAKRPRPVYARGV